MNFRCFEQSLTFCSVDAMAEGRYEHKLCLEIKICTNVCIESWSIPGADVGNIEGTNQSFFHEKPEFLASSIVSISISSWPIIYALVCIHYSSIRSLAVGKMVIQPLHRIENFFPTDVLIVVLEAKGWIALTIVRKNVVYYNGEFLHGIDDSVCLGSYNNKD